MSPPAERRMTDPLTAMLTQHIDEEEEAFSRGEKRMEAIEAELAPIKKMYWAVIGSATVGTILLTALVFIYQNDRAEIKNTQDVLYKQGLAIERLLVVTHELSRGYDRLEREGDKINSKVDGLRR